MQYTEHDSGGLVFRRASNISAPHAFTTRFGGVSEGIFASLDLAENRGDEPERVRENYRRLGALFGCGPDDFVFTRQVHRDDVRVVTAADRHTLFSPVPYEADGIVTAECGLPVICFTADCIPLLLCDEENGVIAAVHCGWRSTVMDIPAKAVARMVSLGAKPENIQAATGAAIGKCCFETGGDVAEAVFSLLGVFAAQFVREHPQKEDKYLVDLQGVVGKCLQRAGVPEGNILLSDECTMCLSGKYWSHRATKGERGSQAAVIMLEGAR